MPTKTEYLYTLEQYGNVFKPSEFEIQSGTGMTDLDYGFFKELNKFRAWADTSMLITSAFRPGDDGAHGLGLAIDVILFDEWLGVVTDPLRQWLLATTWPWLGVGIYFDWQFVDKNGKRQPAVGLHLDLHKKGSRPLRWLRLSEPKQDGDKELAQYYYYQNTINGQFYNSKKQKSVELSNVISKLWQ